MGKCFKCDKESQIRRLVEGLCTVCSKVKAKTVINVPTSGLLTAGALKGLPQGPHQQEQLGPDDSLSMIDPGRRQQMMKDELKRFAKDDYNEEVEPRGPSKRLKTTEDWSFSTPPTVAPTSHTDASILELLKDIEVSQLAPTELSFKLQKVSAQLTQDIVIQYLTIRQPSKLPSVVAELLPGASQLHVSGRVGLLLTSFVLSGVCWYSARQMLTTMASEQRSEVLSTFALYVSKLYCAEVAVWVTTNWKVIEDEHLRLIKHLKGTELEVGSVLDLSLGVTLVDISRFLDAAEALIEYPVVELVLECLHKSPKQQKISFDSFLALICCIRAQSNQPTITTCRQQLIGTPLAHWIEFIDLKRAELKVANADSIQSFIDQLVEANGEVISALNQDLTKSDDKRFGMFLHLTQQFKANNKQFAAAQYSVGLMTIKQRQLWKVPCSHGKTRIVATVGAIGKMTGIVSEVHIVSQDKYLMNRDKKEFALYWQLLDIGETEVQYHYDMDFEPKPNSLIICDEADKFMIEDHAKFSKIIRGCFCICFTGTPDNCDANGIQKYMIDQLQFIELDYVLDASVNDAPKLQVDEVLDAPRTEQKADYIVQQLKNGPVLVFCGSPLAEYLNDKLQNLVLNIDDDVDCGSLRALDQQPFKVLIAQKKSAMRGRDYRCEKALMTLVLAKSFSYTTQAIQGLGRVGRGGDQCKRIRFQDVEIVDTQKESEYTAKLFKYFSSIQQTTVGLKQAKATIKDQPEKSASTYPYSKQTLRQVSTLQGQTKLPESYRLVSKK